MKSHAIRCAAMVGCLIAAATALADEPLPQVVAMTCPTDTSEPVWRVINPADAATDGTRMLVVPTMLLVAGGTCADVRALTDDALRFVNFRWAPNSITVEVRN